MWLFWEADTWRFDGWYVNLQSPFVRTSLGFDATDDILDIEIEIDRSWAWKDEDELEEAVLAREPYTKPWVDWRPDERWSIPALPNGWQSLPPSLLASPDR